MKIASILLLLLALRFTPAYDDNRVPSGPTATDLTGTWNGTSTYPNAPFELVLRQTAATLTGEYNDGLDAGEEPLTIASAGGGAFGLELSAHHGLPVRGCRGLEPTIGAIAVAAHRRDYAICGAGQWVIPPRAKLVHPRLFDAT